MTHPYLTLRALALPLVSLALAVPSTSAQISLGGYVFDDLAAPDAVLAVPGSHPEFGGEVSGCAVVQTYAGLTQQQSLELALLDDGVSEWFFGKAVVQLDFLDNVVVNGPGADLVVFELGGAEGFSLRVFIEALHEWSPAVNVTVTSTGFTQPNCGGTPNAINAAAIDLDSFGIPGGAVVRRLLLDNKGTAGGAVGADIGQVMALHSAPPSASFAESLFSFQQGSGTGGVPYQGAADTVIASDAPDTAFGATAFQYVDGSPLRQALLRFDGLVGSSLGQVPPGSQVAEALLTLSTGAGVASSNGTHPVHRLLQAFDGASSTWANSYGGNGVQADGVEAGVATLASVPPMGANSSVAIDVTAAVQAWVDGEPNHGFVVLPGNSDGLGLQLAEATTASLRPGLTVRLAPSLYYATEVTSFSPAIVGGEPASCYLDPSKALGPPDAMNLPFGGCCVYSDHTVTLGSGGSIVLRFTEVSVSGGGSPEPDLWIHEEGPDVEDTFVELSADGVNWVSVGKVLGAISSVDLDAWGLGPLDLFSYLRLTDDPLEGNTTGCSVGADIDAVAALSPNPWVNLGGGLAGGGVTPLLAASGALASDGPVQVLLSGGPPSGLTHLVMGGSVLGLPFKGGVLMANPDLLVFGLPLDGSGSLLVRTVWPAGLPAGLALVVQYWLPHPSGPFGYLASNALQAFTS